MNKLYPGGCSYLYHIEARRNKSDKWQSFSGIRKTKKQVPIRFFKNHIKEYFDKMDYQFSVVMRIAIIGQRSVPATRIIVV